MGVPPDEMRKRLARKKLTKKEEEILESVSKERTKKTKKPEKVEKD